MDAKGGGSGANGRLFCLVLHPMASQVFREFAGRYCIHYSQHTHDNQHQQQQQQAHNTTLVLRTLARRCRLSAQNETDMNWLLQLALVCSSSATQQQQHQ